MSLDENPSVAIGAIGGSGTRVLARIVEAAGVHMGAELNVSHDALAFTRAFRDPAILGASDADFTARLDRFRAEMRAGDASGRWGWKEPNTHLVIERLLRAIPGLRYVHLSRDGRDMAYSRNQNQLRLWGPIVLGRALPDPQPADALEYHCAVHRRIAALAAAEPDRVLMLRFEALCAAPEAEIAGLLRFLGLEADARALAAMVQPPGSIGRWRAHGTAPFRAEDLAYLAGAGA